MRAPVSERASQPSPFVDRPLRVQCAGKARAAGQVHVDAAVAQGIGKRLLRVLPGTVALKRKLHQSRQQPAQTASCPRGIAHLRTHNRAVHSQCRIQGRRVLPDAGR